MVTVEEFFKELQALANLRANNKCTRKELRKVLGELLQPPKATALGVEKAERANAALFRAEQAEDDEDPSQIFDLDPYSAYTNAISAYTWPELFHAHFASTNEMIAPSTVEAYERLVSEYVAELHQSLGKEDPGERKANSSSGPSSKAQKLIRCIQHATSFLDFLRTHRTDAVNCLLGITPAENVLTKYCPLLLRAQQEYIRQQQALQQEALKAHQANDQKKKKKESSRPLSDSSVTVQATASPPVNLKTPPTSLPTSPAGSSPPSPRSPISPPNDASVTATEAAPTPNVSDSNATKLEDYSPLSSPTGSRHPTSYLRDSIEQQQQQQASQQLQTKSGSLPLLLVSPSKSGSGAGTGTSTPTSSQPTSTLSRPPSVTSTLTPTARMSRGLPTSSTVLSQQSLSKIAISNPQQPQQQFSRQELIRHIQEWASYTDGDLLLHDVQAFARQLEELGPLVNVGDLVIVRRGSSIFYGRVAGVLGLDVIMVRTNPSETGCKSFHKQDVAPFPDALLPLLGSAASAKRLIENPVEAFYRGVVERVKDEVLNHFAKNGVDVETLDKAVHKKLTLGDEPALHRLAQKQSAVISLGAEEVIAKLEEYLTVGTQELRKNLYSNPLMLEVMKSISGLRIRSLVTKRFQDYQTKVMEAQDFLRAERQALLSGAKKAQLAEWWLQAIQEKVTMFLEEQGYDTSAVPTNYINEPPKSMWLVQKNLDFVRRWMRPQTEEDTRTLKNLIRSISNQVYPQLDRFLANTEYLLMEQLQKLPTSTPLPEPKASGTVEERLNEIKSLINSADEDMATSFDPDPPLRSLTMATGNTRFLRNLLMDCEYVLEMKKLEVEAEKSINLAAATQKFVISKAVPLGGLVMGCFARMENELNTVKELWYSSSLTAMKVGGVPTLPEELKRFHESGYETPEGAVSPTQNLSIRRRKSLEATLRMAINAQLPFAAESIAAKIAVPSSSVDCVDGGSVSFALSSSSPPVSSPLYSPSSTSPTNSGVHLTTGGDKRLSRLSQTKTKHKSVGATEKL